MTVSPKSVSFGIICAKVAAGNNLPDVMRRADAPPAQGHLGHLSVKTTWLHARTHTSLIRAPTPPLSFLGDFSACAHQHHLTLWLGDCRHLWGFLGGLPELIRSAKFHWEILAKVSLVLCGRFMHISFKGTCPIPTLIIVVTYHYFLYAWPWFSLPLELSATLHSKKPDGVNSRYLKHFKHLKSMFTAIVLGTMVIYTCFSHQLLYFNMV